MKTLILASCAISLSVIYMLFFGLLKVSLTEFVLGIAFVVFAIEFVRVAFASIAKLMEKSDE